MSKRKTHVELEQLLEKLLADRSLIEAEIERIEAAVCVLTELTSYAQAVEYHETIVKIRNNCDGSSVHNRATRWALTVSPTIKSLANYIMVHHEQRAKHQVVSQKISGVSDTLELLRVKRDSAT